MTVTTPPFPSTVAGTAAPPQARRAGLGRAVAILTFGHLAWLGWLWAVVAFGNAVALAAIGRWGSLPHSLWSQAFAGWQHWVIGAAGVVTTVVFVDLFVTNGATRSLQSRAAMVFAPLVSIACAAIVTAGYVVEGWWFDRQDWPHLIDTDGRPVDDIGLPSIFLAVAVTFLAAFVSGWANGALLRQRSAPASWLLVPVALAPFALAQWLLAGELGLTQFDFLRDLARPGWPVGVPVTLAATALTAAAARWMTHRIDVP